MTDKKDDRDYIKKALDGDVSSYSSDDTLDALSAASRALPGKFGDMAAAPIEAFHGSLTSDRDYRESSKALGRDLNAAAHGSNRALRRKLDEIAGRSGSKFAEYSTLGAGAIVGGTAGSAILPIPLLGTTAGVWAGSEGAQLIYDEAIRTQDQDAVGLVIEMKEMQKRRQPVAAEHAFAALASNLPDKEAKKVEDRLFALTGKRKFADAIADGNMGAITKLMNEFDMDIRVDTGMPYNPANPSKTASQEYAELINNGTMDARALLFREDMPSIMEITKRQMEQQKQSANKPRLAFRGGQPVSQGTTVAADEQPKNILPGNFKKPDTKGRAG